MKSFDYYRKKYIDFKSRSSIQEKLYIEANFDPDKIDSKSEERRIRDQLDKQAEQLYKDYVKQNDDLCEEFKNDLFEEFDLIEHPKAELLYMLAWMDSETFEDVYYAVEKWVALIKD